jgi:hypothetical protein
MGQGILMAEVNTFRCDGPGCKNVKGETNHWFRAVKWSESFEVAHWDYDFDDMSQALRGDGKMLHFCSESCVVKKMSEIIGAGK